MWRQLAQVRGQVRGLVRGLARRSLRPRVADSLHAPRSLPVGTTRSRFAPSPTGLLHLGLLRTALFNYLLAKHTGGQYLLRIEDTDQKRLVPGAEAALIRLLNWLGLEPDEGPETPADAAGYCGPYKQLERTEVYQEYAEQLVRDGKAYRCYCLQDRLDGLRRSAAQLKPPTTATYDRHCGFMDESASEAKRTAGGPFTIRFRAPDDYPPVRDALRGWVNLQPQVNPFDRRYDDAVLLKSDGTPTYHLAHVVDDHLMKVLHVIRGEEWLPLTPKHIALFEAFGWVPPVYCHVPLLTLTSDKKLLKRQGDMGVEELRARGVLPEALLNFVALLGWHPNAGGLELFLLPEMVERFLLEGLVSGNAKVDMQKLDFFNKHYMKQRLLSAEGVAYLAEEHYERFERQYPGLTRQRFEEVVAVAGSSVTYVPELLLAGYLWGEVSHQGEEAQRFVAEFGAKRVQEVLAALVARFVSLLSEEMAQGLLGIARELLAAGTPKALVYGTFRYAVLGLAPGVKIPELAKLFTGEEIRARMQRAADSL